MCVSRFVYITAVTIGELFVCQEVNEKKRYK